MNNLGKNLPKILEINRKVFEPLKNMWKESDNWKKSHPILDAFLKEVWLPQNEETRYIAYERIANLKIVLLDNYLEKYIHQIKANFSGLKIKTPYENLSKQYFLDKAYKFVSDLYLDYFRKFVKEIKEKQLLDEFYLTLFEWGLDIIKSFNDFYFSWSNYIQKQNEILSKKFKRDSEKIMAYLKEKDLLEKDEKGNYTDRSYTVLKWWKMVSYVDAFPSEIYQIAWSISDLVEELLSKDLDEEKKLIIEYLQAIKDAYLEKNIKKLLWKRQKVDQLWMEIKWPIQIAHPMEYYDDLYRKAVQPEFDIRILDTETLKSEIRDDVLNMFDTLFEEFDEWKYFDVYEFSKNNLNRTLLFISEPVIYGWGYMNWHISAQVLPNNEIVSKEYGKKIFAFPKRVLEQQKNSEDPRYRFLIIDESVLEEYRNSLEYEKDFYKIYDILTIWHEFWHTLWVWSDTELKMNIKTWNFKNVEEWKATTGWLVSYFLKVWVEEKPTNFDRKLILSHFKRVVTLIERFKIWELMPYYNETLIHLDLLHRSWILEIRNNKAYFNFNDENYKKLKILYLKVYKDLVKIYLDKKDAGEFLFKYVISENGINLPVNKVLKEFVKYYNQIKINI